ncbi:hypothetical protein HanPI659440_Chr12g0460441 [Helianthus annuus]|nr:hypothetical protein HanPI659440_Chr12g0460441 [Helianthus annuus]
MNPGDLKNATLAAANAANLQTELDSIIGTSTRIPRLMTADDYLKWKFRFEQYVKAKEPKVWRCILRGPYVITYTTQEDSETKLKKPEEFYSDEYFEIIEEDAKALSYLTMALGPDISVNLRDATSAK